MAIRYRKINPTIWTSDLIVDADDFARSIWFALHFGPAVTNLPGLMATTAASLTDVVRRDVADIEEVLVEFEGAGLIERDRRALVLRMPHLSKEHEPENVNVIKGWATTFQSIQECPVKRRHLLSLRSVVVPKLVKAFLDAFEVTESDLSALAKATPPLPRGSFAELSKGRRRSFGKDFRGAFERGSESLSEGFQKRFRTQEQDQEQEKEQEQIPPDPAASSPDHCKPHARTHEASPVEPLDADDPPVYHPVQLANLASYGIPLTVPGETKAQGQARRRAALAAALEADLGPDPGSSGQGGDEGEEDPDPPSGRPSLDGHAPALGSPQDAPAPPATPSRPSEAQPAPASALPAPPGHVAVEGEVWPPPAGWIPEPESVLRTCGSCSHGRRFPEPLLCPCPLGEHAARICAQRELEAAEEARELAREQKRRAKKLDAPPLFGPETPAEQAAASAPDTTPLGKLGMGALLPPPGYGAKIPDDPAALILATLERQPEPLRHLADPGVCSRLAGAVMGTKATVAQIEDAIRMASSKLPAELGDVRADDPRGLDRVQRWIAGCLKGCRNQGPGRAAPHDPSESLPIVTRRILTRFAAAYREQEGIDYLAGEEDPAHAEVIAGHLKRQVEAAAQRAGTAPDAALGGAMLAQLIETWMGSKLGEATGHALAQLASALRREPARWVYRPTAPDPYAGVALGPAPTHAPGFRNPMPPTVLKPRADLDNVVDIFAKKRVSG